MLSQQTCRILRKFADLGAVTESRLLRAGGWRTDRQERIHGGSWVDPLPSSCPVDGEISRWRRCVQPAPWKCEAPQPRKGNRGRIGYARFAIAKSRAWEGEGFSFQIQWHLMLNLMLTCPYTCDFIPRFPLIMGDLLHCTTVGLLLIIQSIFLHFSMLLCEWFNSVLRWMVIPTRWLQGWTQHTII